MKKYIPFFLLALISFVTSAQSITVTNGAGGSTWSVPALSSVITKGGKNYEHIETSAASHTLLKVNSLLVWGVSVQQSGISNWDPALKISVRRTGDGTGGAIIGGGAAYIQLTTSSQAFFSGLLGLGFSRDNVPIQYKIEGLSVLLPVKTYTTTIIYTISGL
ncbi:hypothetical protein [Dyadobacter sp. NIV53]|uniref:hypothetical protein n=1 Tax=Dyadobacter sp. NIV53 TaxID=2861765 RepID=UPI001C87AE9D|nr:hypothetical protein [Dyadobacter sp. NIV53]